MSTPALSRHHRQSSRQDRRRQPLEEEWLASTCCCALVMYVIALLLQFQSLSMAEKHLDMEYEQLNHLLWPNNTLPLMLDTAFDTLEELFINMTAMEISLSTNLKVVNRTNEASYARVIRAPDLMRCGQAEMYHRKGRTPPEQPEVRLNPTGKCMISGTILHELLHVAGLGHVHQRLDRDRYIVVHKDNIPPDYLSSYDKARDPLWPQHGYPQHIPYDTRSVMHYSDFECPGAITTRGGQSIEGPNYKLTPSDIALVNELYPVGVDGQPLPRRFRRKPMGLRRLLSLLFLLESW